MEALSACEGDVRNPECMVQPALLFPFLRQLPAQKFKRCYVNTTDFVIKEVSLNSERKRMCLYIVLFEPKGKTEIARAPLALFCPQFS